MRSVFLFIAFLLVSFVGVAQTTETKYYRTRPFDTEVPENKANYSRTVTNDNGTITTTIKNLKKGTIEDSETWKGDEPYGIWVGRTGRGPEELDFNFEVPYKESTCSNVESLKGLTDFFADNIAVGYTAPVIDFEEKRLGAFVGRSLRYPAYARRHGIQGSVELAFVLTKEGKAQDIAVTKGVHLLLDKEAVRVIRKLKFSRPALLNGEPVEMCVKLPLKFKLAN
ncbi:energy transducer TonB [Chryseolinea lacunae]|uniref:Energy transducer TonB n=1 Tax=Chryseolinea lacunae TaxID=2801331 RepID=A0ABS1KML9_9BACT|nr:energy transducer TonB [Chryseolinea lacunae]MBL0740584.1 energy transducer TonB [Chryseolinea lacunae]